MSEKHWFSPQEIVMGLTIDYKLDCKSVVGAYIEASIDTDITINDVERRQSCIYLRLPRNRQGSVNFFLVIDTGTVIIRQYFDVFPYPGVLLTKVEN